MKQLIVFLSLFIFFIGCSNQEQVYTPKKQITPKLANSNEDFSYEPIEKDDFITEDSNEFKVAIVFPSKVVGKYANYSLDTILGYLLFKNQKFEIESFDSIDQSSRSIKESFEKIQEGGYKKIIALYTAKALKEINKINFDKKVQVYFPLINKSEQVTVNNKFLYGAISYEQQLEKLLTLSNGTNSMFYEQTSLGRRLKSMYDEQIPTKKVEKVVSKIDTNYKRLVKDKRIEESTLVLNTPIIKSSIILSQLRAHEIEPKIILSTQLNYNPLLVSLTQFEDRVNFVIANSIEPSSEVLTQTIDLFDADIKYNWVNYSSLIGVNHFFSMNRDNLLKNKIMDNEVKYKVHLYHSTSYGFEKFNF